MGWDKSDLRRPDGVIEKRQTGIEVEYREDRGGFDSCIYSLCGRSLSAFLLFNFIKSDDTNLWFRHGISNLIIEGLGVITWKVTFLNFREKHV